MLGMLIRATNPLKPIIDLRSYKVDPKDFEDRPLEDDEPEVPKPRAPRGKYKPRGLNELQAKAIALWCAGYTYAEISKMTGYGRSAIKNRVWRIKQKLGTSKRYQIAPMLRGMGIAIPQSKRPTLDSVSGLMEVVVDVVAKGGELAFTVPKDQRFENIEKWAHTYAKRIGGQISCRHINGVVWIMRRAA